MMHPRLRVGARQGFRVFLPQSLGLVPWALATGVAMVDAGLTPGQAMGMNLIVFNGTVQLAVLPLIVAGVPLWLLVATAFALNLRIAIFSAAIAPGFRGMDAAIRWLAAHLLSNGVFAGAVAPGGPISPPASQPGRPSITPWRTPQEVSKCSTRPANCCDGARPW